MKQLLIIITLLISVGDFVFAQTPEVLKIRDHSSKNAGSIIKEFSEFLTISNVAADAAGQQKTAAFIMSMMNKRGIEKVQLLNATTAGVPPVEYGEVMVPGAKQTLIFYSHYDGQPVNPAQWAKELDPFKPVLFTGAIDKNGMLIPFPPDGSFQKEWRIRPFYLGKGAPKLLRG